MEILSSEASIIVIPIVSALVGWFTNFIAVKMMFYPLKFTGVFPPYLGWQGLIHSKAIEMAEISVDLLLGKMLSVEAMALKVDHNQITYHIQRRINHSLDKIIDDAMDGSLSAKWISLPLSVKKYIHDRIKDKVPFLVEQLIDDIKYSIREILDIKELVVNYLEKHPALLNEMFMTAGGKEFTFVIKSGFYFGFVLGIPTMLIWNAYQIWWVLPLGGALVGYLTNWIALKIIFEPQNPVYFGRFKFQGLFLSRQQEVAVVYAALLQSKLLNANNIFDAMLSGTGKERLEELISMHVDHALEEAISPYQIFFVSNMGHQNFKNLKEGISQEVFSEAKKISRYAETYIDEVLDIRRDLESKMKGLSPEEFEGVLRPAYQKDEWKLIALGCFLGCTAGVLNLLFFLA
jgi:uncharacterized membrane protein YheB (UPF0754 family)